MRRRGGRPLGGDRRLRALRGARRLCTDSGVRRELRERVRCPAPLRARCRLAMAVSSHHAAKMDASVLRCRNQSMCAAFRSTRWRATLSGETPAARREKASPANGPNSAVAQLVSAQNMDHWRLARPTYPAIHGASRFAAPYGRHGEATSSAIVIVNLPATTREREPAPGSRSAFHIVTSYDRPTLSHANQAIRVPGLVMGTHVPLTVTRHTQAVYSACSAAVCSR